MKRLALMLAFLFLPATGSASERLCPPLPPLPVGADDLRMDEDAFTLEAARDSLVFLRYDFPKKVWGPEPAKDLRSASHHTISYSNSLKIVQGSLLRDIALRLRSDADLLRLTKPDSAELNVAETASEDAAHAFCEFVGVEAAD